jgi:hypothetical protein
MTNPLKKTMRRPDAAARFRDTVALHQVALDKQQLLSRRCWIAIRLSDGGSDNTVYDSREDAIHHQLFPTQCGYLPVPFERISEYVCDTLLWYWEKMYDAGHKPLDNSHVIIPGTFDGMMDAIRQVGGNPL